MKPETVTEVVKKLIGDITPAGATHIDEYRFDNLKTMCHVVEQLIIKIDQVAYHNKDRQEYSMKEMGEYASNFLTKNIGITEQ